jgi:hypothetical protein
VATAEKVGLCLAMHTWTTWWSSSKHWRGWMGRERWWHMSSLGEPPMALSVDVHVFSDDFADAVNVQQGLLLSLESRCGVR